MHAVVPFSTDHLDQLTSLVDVHLGAVIPGWVTPPSRLAARLRRDPGEYVVDPWVVERRTLVAVERGRVVAAAHLLRYGDEERVGPAYRGQSEISWLLAWPQATDAASSLMDECLSQLDEWKTPEHWAFDSSIYSPMTSGIPDAWPHLAALARETGFSPNVERTEYLHLGWIEDVPPPPPPRPGLTIRRTPVDQSTRFALLVGDQQIGIFDVSIRDGWADPWNLEIEPEHRSQGIGTWLVRSACQWLRLGGADRLIVSTDLKGSLDGASRFYERLGWPVIAVFERGWTRSASVFEGKSTV